MGAASREIYEGESYVVAIDYADKLPIGSTAPSGAQLVAHEWVDNAAGDEVTSSFLDSATGTVDGMLLLFRFKTVPPDWIGKTFRVRSLTEFDDGQKRVDRVLFQAVEG